MDQTLAGIGTIDTALLSTTESKVSSLLSPSTPCPGLPIESVQLDAKEEEGPGLLCKRWPLVTESKEDHGTDNTAWTVAAPGTERCLLIHDQEEHVCLVGRRESWASQHFQMSAHVRTALMTSVAVATRQEATIE